MENINSNILSTIVIHPHPIVELQIKNLHKDECGFIADCIIYNKEFNEMESSFLLTEEIAKEIIDSMQSFLKNINRRYELENMS